MALGKASSASAVASMAWRIGGGGEKRKISAVIESVWRSGVIGGGSGLAAAKWRRRKLAGGVAAKMKNSAYLKKWPSYQWRSAYQENRMYRKHISGDAKMA
jgi:hypothetical protein